MIRVCDNKFKTEKIINFNLQQSFVKKILQFLKYYFETTSRQSLYYVKSFFLFFLIRTV